MTPRMKFALAASALLLPAAFAEGCRPQSPQPGVAGTPRRAVAAVDPNAFRPDEFAQISVRAQAERIPVIMYHDVIARRSRKSVWFDCTKAEFASQLDFLQEQGAHPITLLQLHKHLVRGESLPEKPVVLTFDDNYQGFYDNAYPLLKARGYPSAMFVHTKFVGDVTGDHPKMTWETLQALDKDGLVTIASHTVSHPDDITKLMPDVQDQELTVAKQELEAKLGHSVPYLAYPDGRQDETTRELAKKAGYTMAFTVDNGPVEESPDILALNRYIHTRLKKAWEDCTQARAAAAVYEQPLKGDAPVRLEVKEYAGIPMGLVRGGVPSSRRGTVRQNVGTFVQEASGVAGINGTFFADARLIGTGGTLIGPSHTALDTAFQPETNAYRLMKIRNRPLVVWGPSKIAIFPFQPGTMNTEEAFKEFMPDYTDVFLAGAWLVHNGKARTEEELEPIAAGDFQDTRRRAFFGVTSNGETVLGATLTVVSSTRMAEAAVEAGVQEAVLLDSGFSTSLVFDKKIIVTGHTDRNLPSRPVPHAIVVTGTLEQPTDEATVTALREADPAVVADEAAGGRDGAGGAGSVAAADGLAGTHRRKRHPKVRRRRHRRAAPADGAPTDGGAAPTGPADGAGPPATDPQ